MKRHYLTENILQRKHELEWTIEKISKESGVGVRTVNRIFAGQDVRFSSITAVLDALDIDLSLRMKKAG